MANEQAGKREQREEERGLECPRCGCKHFYVLNTRAAIKGVWRRRQCRHCGRMLSTIEKLREWQAGDPKPASPDRHSAPTPNRGRKSS